MTGRHFTPGQLVFPDLIPGAFWVVTQSHGVIPDGRRFLVVEHYAGDYWLAWEGRRCPVAPGDPVEGQRLSEGGGRR